jgi:hypothetical protein
MKTISLRALSQLALIAALFACTNAVAQSDNPAENKEYIAKWVKDMGEYIDAKCSGFKPSIDFNDAGVDYATNPSNGTPATVDRITAPFYGIAHVCEMGDAPTNALKGKFNAIRLRQGAANSVKLSGKTLDVTFAARSSEPSGKLREFFKAQLNRI